MMILNDTDEVFHTKGKSMYLQLNHLFVTLRKIIYLLFIIWYLILMKIIGFLIESITIGLWCHQYGESLWYRKVMHGTWGYSWFISNI